MTETRVSEKRRYARYPNSSLSIAVSRRGLGNIFRANPRANCLNFSRTGIQFDSSHELKDGERLLVDAQVQDIEVDDLLATVVSRQPLPDGGWCYGARFCLEDPAMNRDRIYHDLLRIEAILKTCQED